MAVPTLQQPLLEDSIDKEHQLYDVSGRLDQGAKRLARLASYKSLRKLKWESIWTLVKNRVVKYGRAMSAAFLISLIILAVWSKDVSFHAGEEHGTFAAFLGKKGQYSEMCDHKSQQFVIHNSQILDEAGLEKTQFSGVAILDAGLDFFKIVSAVFTGPVNFIPDADEWLQDPDNPEDMSAWICPLQPLVRLGNIIPDIKFAEGAEYHWTNILKGYPRLIRLATAVEASVRASGQEKRATGTEYDLRAAINSLAGMPHRIHIGNFHLNMPWSARVGSYMFLGNLLSLVLTVGYLSYTTILKLLQEPKQLLYWQLLACRAEMFLPILVLLFRAKITCTNIELFFRSEISGWKYAVTNMYRRLLWVACSPTLLLYGPAVLCVTAVAKVVAMPLRFFEWDLDENSLIVMAPALLCSTLAVSSFAKSMTKATYFCTWSRLSILTVDPGSLTKIDINVPFFWCAIIVIACAVLVYTVSAMWRMVTCNSSKSTATILLEKVFQEVVDPERAVLRWYQAPMCNALAIRTDYRAYEEHIEHFVDGNIQERGYCKYCDKFCERSQLSRKGSFSNPGEAVIYDILYKHGEISMGSASVILELALMKARKKPETEETLSILENAIDYVDSQIASGEIGIQQMLKKQVEEARTLLLNSISRFDAAMLKKNGFSPDRLVQAGWSLLQLAQAGFDLSGSDEYFVLQNESGNATAVLMLANGEVLAWGDKDCGGDASKVEEQLCGGVKKLVATSRAFAALKDDGSAVFWGDAYAGDDEENVQPHFRNDISDVSVTDGVFVVRKRSGILVVLGDAGLDLREALYEEIVQAGFTIDDLHLEGLRAKQLWNLGFDEEELFTHVGIRLHHFYQRDYFAVAALEGGAVTAWGSKKDGGDASKVQSELRFGVRSVTATDGAFAALKEDGSVVVWGKPAHGGDASRVKDQLSGGVMLVAHADLAFAALKWDGSVVAWGDRMGGGDASVVQDQLCDGVEAIIDGVLAFAAVKKNRRVVYWGHPEFQERLRLDLSIPSELESRIRHLRQS